MLSGIEAVADAEALGESLANHNSHVFHHRFLQYSRQASMQPKHTRYVRWASFTAMSRAASAASLAKTHLR